MLLLLLLPSLAQDFASRFQEHLSKDDLPALARLISENPGPAEEHFRKYVGILIKTRGAHKEEDVRAANILARGLLFARENVPTMVLNGEQVLYSVDRWKGSVFDESKKPAPTPEEIAQKKALKQQQAEAREGAQKRFEAQFQNPLSSQTMGSTCPTGSIQSPTIAHPIPKTLCHLL